MEKDKSLGIQIFGFFVFFFSCVFFLFVLSRMFFVLVNVFIICLCFLTRFVSFILPCSSFLRSFFSIVYFLFVFLCLPHSLLFVELITCFSFVLSFFFFVFTDAFFHIRIFLVRAFALALFCFYSLVTTFVDKRTENE